MKCPKCQFENLEGLKFCGECGAKLEKICPHCNSSNPPQFKFCGECGRNLSIPSEAKPKELSFDEKLAKIQRYLPKGLTEKILSQRDKIEGERKQVTVIFCDMEGFTPLVEKLGPEEAYSIMNQVYEILIHKVHDYEGTVNEMTGDGIMALFGAPIALEDAPQRAIRSALAIHREMARFSDKIKTESRIPPIKMRIGIHTGPVVVGTLGNDLRVEFKAVGDTVNLASRMEGLADPGKTYVTEDTFKLTEGFFRFEALGEKKVKGKEELIRVYQVIAPSTRRTRFDVSAERGLTPFVGRERELVLLLDGFERVKAGNGQAFSIISEAGVGKSRLLYEFRKAVANEDVTFLEGRCFSYSKGVAYHPFIDILKSNFNIHEGEGDPEVREKVKRSLKITEVDETSTLPYLLELLLVKDSGIDQISMSPEARKDRIIEALKRIALKGSEMRPLIMAFEDLHWLDKGSEDVLKSLLESIPGARVLLIFTYRPEFIHIWGAKSYHSQLTLHRLSNRESLEMVTQILGIKEIERALEDLIIEKTEGVPFFIEQFIKSLKDLKIIEKKENAYRLSKDIQHLTIPSTIQDVIMARVDSLPEGAKGVLQTGSVIEREFSYPLMKGVMDLKEQELLSHLSILKDSELLYERGIYPQSTYVFKHTLTREVVYDSILAKRKKKLHEEIGNAIEELYKDSLGEHYEVLTEHYFLSENYLKSAEFSRLASRKAEKTASLNDAIVFAKKRVESIEQLPQTEDVKKQIIDARTALGLYMIQMNYHVEAKEFIAPIIDLAIKHDYKKRLCQVYTILGSYNWVVEENYPETFKVLEEALKISKEVGDNIASVLATISLGGALGYNSEFERSEDCLKKSLHINVATKTLWGIAVTKSYLAYFSYYLSGKINLGFQTTQEAVSIAEESGDIYSKALAYTSHGISCYGKGLLREAEKYLLKGVEYCERINLTAWNGNAQFHLGETYFEMADFLRSKEHYEKVSWFLGNIRSFPSWMDLVKVVFAKSKVMSKEKGLNLESLYIHSRNNKIRTFEGKIQRYIGEILLNIDDQHLSDAEHWIQKAIEADQRNRMMFHLGKDYALYAELFKRKGDRLKTQENLGKAIEILKECGADGWVAHSFWSQEDHPKAFQYLQEALKIAEELKDFVTLWVANHWMGHLLSENCEFENAFVHLERDLKISTLANIQWSISIMKSCIAINIYGLQGKADLAYQNSHEGLKLAEESGDTFSKAEAYTSCGISSYVKGFLDEAEEYLVKGIAFSERINYSAMSAMASAYLGEAYFDWEEYPRSQYYYNKFISVSEQMKLWPSRINLGKILLAKAKVMNKDKAINLDVLYECAEQNKLKLEIGNMAKGICHILMNIDDDHIIEADQWVNKAIEADQRNRLMWRLGKDYALYGDLFKRKGDRLKAQENLGRAIEIFKECGADGWVEKYKKEMVSIL